MDTRARRAVGRRHARVYGGLHDGDSRRRVNAAAEISRVLGKATPGLARARLQTWHREAARAPDAGDLRVAGTDRAVVADARARSREPGRRGTIVLARCAND